MDEKRVQKLLKQAISYISLRDRSTQELTEYVSQKTQNDPDSEELVTVVINRIRDFNLLNDTDFAKKWVDSRLKKGKGMTTIRYELKQKGVSETDIRAAVSPVDTEEWTKSARDYLDKKRSLWQKFTGFKRIGKMRQLLSNRGFEGRTINTVIDDFSDEEVQ